MNRSLRVFVLLLFISSINAGTQNALDPHLQETEFDLFFDRADRVSQLQGWLDIVDQGLAEHPEWEQDRFERMLEQRLGQWLNTHFQQLIPQADFSVFFRSRQQANLQFLYDTQGTGILQYDSQGNPVLRDAALIDPDQTAWSELLHESITFLIDSWESDTQVVYEELLYALNEKTSPIADHLMTVSMNRYRENLSGELQRLYTQAENAFLKRRLADSFSLRKKTEQKTAGQLAAGLIKETQQELQQATSALAAGLQTALKAPDEALVLSLDNWEQSFRRSFADGMERWEQAERDFLQERIQWEITAQQEYRQAEEAWDEAFTSFRRQREKWAREIIQLTEDGREAWEEKEQDFFLQMEAVVADMELATGQEIARFSEEIDVHTSIFQQSVQMIELADTNSLFFQAELDRIDQYRQDKQLPIEQINLEIERIEDFLTNLEAAKSLRGVAPLSVLDDYNEMLEELRAERDRLVAIRDSKNEELRSFAAELDYWREIKTAYSSAKDEAEDSLYSLLASLEQSGTGNDSWIFSSNSYEQELRRLEQREAMLARQVEISRAVIAYAEDRSSSRDTEAESLAKYEAALALVAERREAYTRQIAVLSMLTDQITEAQAAAVDQQQIVNALQQAFDGAKEEFERQQAMWKVSDVSLLELVVQGYQKEIDGYFEGQRAELHQQYFQASEAAIREELLRSAEALCADLEGTSTDRDAFVDRDRLAQIILALEQLELDWQIPLESFIAGLQLTGVDKDHRVYDQLIQAYAEGIGDDETSALARPQAAALLASIQDDYVLQLHKTDELLDLLRMEQLGQTPEKIHQSLVDRAAAADLEYLIAKARLERDAMLVLIGSGSQTDPQALELAETAARLNPDRDWSYVDVEEIERTLQLLERTAVSLTTGQTGEGIDPEELLRIQEFIQGADLFSGDGWHPTDNYLRPLQRAAAEAAAGLEIWQSYASVSPAVNLFQRQRTAEQLQKLFSAVPAAEGGQFYSAVELDTTANYLELFESLHRMSNSVPEYVLVMAEQYLGARAAASALQPEIADAISEAELNLEPILARYQRLSGTDPELTKAGFLYKEGFDGSKDLLLHLISDYIQQRAHLLGDGPDLLAVWLQEAVQLAGLPENAIQWQELEAFRLSSSSQPSALPYIPLIHGDLKDFVDRYLPETAYQRAYWTAVHATGSSQPSSESVFDLYLQDTIQTCSTELIAAYARFSALNAVKNLPDWKGEQINAREAMAFQDLLMQAIITLGAEEWEQGTENTQSANTYQTLLTRAAEIASLIQKAAEVQLRIDNWEQVLSESSAGDLGQTQSAMDSAQKDLNEQRKTYTEMLTLSAELIEQYNRERVNLDTAYTLYQESNWTLQEASEIRDYALSGYSLENCDPWGVYENRREEHDRARTVLDIVCQLYETGEDLLPVEERLDPDYSALKAKESTVLGYQNYLLNTYQAIETTIRESDETLGLAYREMEDRAYHFFSFSNPAGQSDEQQIAFRPDFDQAPAGLTDFSGVSQPELDTRLDAYFTDDQLDERFSTDVVLWLTGIQAHGPDILKKFGFAYYHDSFALGTDESITLAFTNNPCYRNLAEEYVDGIGESRLIAALQDQAQRIHSNLTEDEEVYRLYSFFKAIMYRGMIVFDTSFIEKDLNYSVYTFADDLAAQAQKEERKHFLWWDWLSKEGKKIRELRKGMKQISGNQERDEIEEDADTFLTHHTLFLDKQDSIDTLLSSDENAPWDYGGFKQIAESISGIPIEESMDQYLESLFASLDLQEKASCLTALRSLMSGTEKNLTRIQQDVRVRVKELVELREAANHDYLYLITRDVLDTQEIEAAAQELFYQPTFTSEDYHRSSASFAGQVEDYGNSLCRASKLNRLGHALVASYRDSLQRATIAEQESLQIAFEELKRRRDCWEQRTAELFETGLGEWELGWHRMIGQREHWQEDFGETFEQCAVQWQDKYTLFQISRDLWVEQSAAKAAETGSVALSREMGLDAERLIAEARTITIPDLKIPKADLSRMMNSLVDTGGLSTMLDNARFLLEQTGVQEIPIAAFLPVSDRTGSLLAVDSFQRDLFREIHAHVALVGALQVKKIVDEAEQGIYEGIAEANKNVAKGINTQLTSSGYRRSGHSYMRDTIIDMTLFGGIEKETHSIGGYVDFAAPSFRIGVDLSQRALEGLPNEVIQAKVDKALDTLKEYSQLLFGSGDEDLHSGIDEGFLRYFEKQTSQFKASSRYTEKRDGQYLFKDTKGLFNFHVGYLPKMKTNDPENVAKSGHGEMGRVYALFFKNEARLGRGLAAMNIPWYSQRMWDDDADNDGDSDGLLGAPSVRSLTDLATSLVATAFLGPGAALLLNLADDALFTLMDVGGGEMTWDEGMVAFGKKAITSSISTGISLGGSAVSTAIDGAAGGVGSVVGKTLFKGVELGATQLTTGAIDAIQYSSENGWGWDQAGFVDSVVGKDAVVSYAFGMTGTFFTSGLNTTLEGFHGELSNNARALNSLVGGLASSAMEYALSGETTLNLLNIRDIGSLLGFEYTDYSGNAAAHGLLEMHIGGDEALFGFGQDGLDISASAVTQSVRGMEAYRENFRIWSSGQENVASAGVGMRALYSQHSKAGFELYENLLAGTDRLIWSESLGAEANTIFDKSFGGRDITVGNLGDDRFSRLHLGVVLEHEAHRDGIVSDPVSQQLETRRAVAARVEMLLALEKKYKGIIGSDIKNTVDILMYQAGEKTFNRYVDELWNGEGDFAERKINNRKIGVRPTTVFDLQKYTPGLCFGIRWGLAGLNQDVYKDYLLPESESDPRNQVLQNLSAADAAAAQWNLVGLILGTGSWAISGGNFGKSVLGLNPLDAPDVLGVMSALLNDATIVSEVIGALGTNNKHPYVSDNVSRSFSQLMRGILTADSLPEMEWYTRATAIYADYQIFDLAEEAGIPLTVDNRWTDNTRREAQVANQMMRNYMFVGEMVFKGIRDPEIIGKMYYEGFANPVSMGNGLTLWENVPGFAQRNPGPWEGWKENQPALDLEFLAKEINAYNTTNFALTTGNMDLYDKLSNLSKDIYEQIVKI